MTVNEVGKKDAQSDGWRCVKVWTGESAITRIDCASGSSTRPPSSMCFSVLPWQAIIRLNTGTDVGDKRVGGREGRGTKMEAQKERKERKVGGGERGCWRK